MSKNQPGTVEKNSSTIGPPAVVTRAIVIIVYFKVVMPASRFVPEYR